MVLGGRTYELTTTPVRDDAGAKAGTVGQWLDRTEQLQAEDEVAQLVQAAVDGDLAQRIQADGKSGFYKTLAEHFNALHSLRVDLWGVAARFVHYCGRELNVFPGSSDFSDEFVAITGLGGA